MNITIFDYKKEYIDVANEFIKNNPQYSYIKTQHIDVRDINCDVLITAGNSFGVMSGGIDLVVNQMMNVEGKVQSFIQKNHNGVLPVGRSICVSTDYKKIPLLIYTPTMFIPTILPETTDNPLMATLSAISLTKTFLGEPSIYIPILCVNTGQVDITRVVSQMCLGIDMIVNNVKVTNDEEIIKFSRATSNIIYGNV